LFTIEGRFFFFSGSCFHLPPCPSEGRRRVYPRSLSGRSVSHSLFYFFRNIPGMGRFLRFFPLTRDRALFRDSSLSVGRRNLGTLFFPAFFFSLLSSRSACWNPLGICQSTPRQLSFSFPLIHIGHRPVSPETPSFFFSTKCPSSGPACRVDLIRQGQVPSHPPFSGMSRRAAALR